MHLPDINFWLALAFQSHQHHPSAKTWMESAAAQSCSFCRVTQMGFLRIVNESEGLPPGRADAGQGMARVRRVVARRRVAFVDEAEGIEAAWRNATQRKTFSTNLWTDAYLAAFARAADWEVVSFDRGFAQFKDLRHTILS